MTSADRGDLPGASALLAGLPSRQGFGDASLIRHRPGSIDLGGGNPDTSVVPVELYRDAVRDLTEHPGFAASLRYVPAAGIPELRAWLAEREGVDDSRILVTAGGTHGLALAVLASLDPGDLILVDDPVYPLFLRILDLVPVRVEPLRVRDDGVDIDDLERRLRAGLRPRALFTVPTFHNPTGASLAVGGARRLADLAERYGFTLILDDPYREVSFTPRPGAKRSSATESDRVVAVNAFSKTLGPALRLGWMVVPADLSEQYVKLRNRLDGQTSGVLQEMVLRIVRRPEYDAGLRSAGEVYAGKAALLAEALTDAFADEISFTAPTGGFFLWARLHGDIDFSRLHDLAQDEGVFYQRGEWFAVDDDAHLRGFVRLSFSEQSPADLREGVDRLRRAWLRVRG
ncbi:aminotransferase-like domain-containing protein [Microbacterium sp. RD1]|uniref:aminotransferase-like domain-containing protein n=1 Tax=Microbacterium sp. RD1 TaxID=3457313 RepID=UPI003FA52B60